MLTYHIHQMEQPVAIIMGRSCHGVSLQEVLHHYPPVMAGGRPVQQHKENYPQPTYASGAEIWQSRLFPSQVRSSYADRQRKKSAMVVVRNLLTGTEVLRTTLTSWSSMLTGDLFEEMSEWEICFLVQITVIHIITCLLYTSPSPRDA